MIPQWLWPGDVAGIQYVRPLLTFALTLLALVAVRHWLLKWLYVHVKEGGFAYIVVETLRFPSVLWCIAGAVQFALDISIIPDKYMDRASTAIIAFLVASLSLAMSSASVRALTIHGQRR